ncbi:hypothetical protein [Chryseolinea soli]|uniref:Uncharacterized protein n=1 Tax=Chryseolinea soli TaxID=2321403 RepID=A0A385SIX6_9BACT|nr:hypothetical protein [Chryseolinea soli]AYB29330.1 hypothetical protein D4L85_01465 [Chryseolinea soli]
MTKSKLTLWAAVGVLAYMVSDVAHEVIGHGGTALLLGSKITLLTSVYFKSVPGNIFVDLGGPMASLLTGVLALAMLKNRKQRFAILLFVHISIYNLFWFAGTVLQSSVGLNGDWTFAIKELNVEAYQGFILIVAGVLCYLLIVRLFSRTLAPMAKESGLSRQDLVMPFLFAALSAFAAGLFFQQARWQAGVEGLLEMTASVPILFLQLNYSPIKRNDDIHYGYGLVVGILYLIFCLTLGQGIRF